MKKVALFCFVFFSIPILSSKHFVLISSPGSGKGTFSQYLVKKYGFVHICPGDIFRDEIRNKTLFGKKIQSTVESGEYIEKKVVCELMEHYLTKTLKEKKQFVLDGFPRAKVSFDFLHQFLKEHNLQSDVCFLKLEAKDETCKKRILGRLVCPKCFKVYHLKSLKKEAQEKCENCGSGLIVREADTEEIVDKRLNFFHSEIEPLVNLAKKHYKVKILNTECSLQTLKEKYENLVK